MGESPLKSPPDDVTAQARPPVTDRVARADAFVWNVIAGPDAGQRFPLDGSQPTRILIGQSPACTVRLTDRQVSRRHAALDWTDDDWHIIDLSSMNGLAVNGVRVVDAFLRPLDLVTLGETTLRFETAPGAPAVALSDRAAFGRITGGSESMRRLYPLFERLAASDVNVVIEGETGTGKEVLAESLHESSRRAAGPFVVFDCTAVAASLVESELFGHERGAFTGAFATRRGVFEQAQGGTLFIDEIGDLDPVLQPKLLRVLERSEVRRVGGDATIRADVRVIAATRRDLDREVQDGRFRDDLFFRLNVARVELPPLRQRQGDVALLAHQFWRDLGGGSEPIPYAFLQRLEHSSWPGNVRELRNAVARQLAVGELGAPVAEDEPDARDAFEQVLALNLPFPRARDRIVALFEQRYVGRVLAEQGTVARAAQASGIARRYFNTILARTKR